MLPLLAVALVSAGALAFEVLLTRLFSIIQWHHFAYMVISIALLGYGASGAFLAVTGNRLHRHVGAAFAAGATLFAASTVASFAVAERLPFNALAVIWEPRQLLYLLVLYLLNAVLLRSHLHWTRACCLPGADFERLRGGHPPLLLQQSPRLLASSPSDLLCAVTDRPE